MNLNNFQNTPCRFWKQAIYTARRKACTFNPLQEHHHAELPPTPAVAASCFCCCAGALGSESDRDIARLSSGTSSLAPSGITSITLFKWSTHAWYLKAAANASKARVAEETKQNGILSGDWSNPVWPTPANRQNRR